MEQIADKRGQLVQAREIRARKSLPAVGDNAPAVPDGWCWVRFGELFSRMGAGSTPAGGEKSYVREGVMFLRSQNVHSSGLVLDGVARIPEATHEKMASTKVRGGDILLNITGASIGRSAIVPAEGWSTANVNQHVSVLRPLLRETTEYLHLAIVSPYFQRLIAASSPGASREGLAIKRLELFLMPMPPLAEQHRIVERVDELMQLCDELDEQQAARIKARSALTMSTLHRVTDANSADDLRAATLSFAEHIDLHLAPSDGDLAALKRLRQAIIELAVRGRLTYHDPADEPAGELLDRIAAERDRLVNAKRMRKQKPLPEVPVEDYPFELPKTWGWARFGNICQSRLGKMLDEEKNTGVPRRYLRNANVQWGRFDLADVKELRLEDSELSEYEVRDGDLLVVEGGYPGRCAVWDSNLMDGVVVFQKALHRVRPLADISSRFIALALRNAVDTDRISEFLTGSGIQHLTGRKLVTLPIPLPPIEEQRRIVDRVAELSAMCDQLEQHFLAARSLRGDLAVSIATHVVLSAPDEAA